MRKDCHKTFSRTYTLQIDSQDIVVCKTFFLTTLSISSGRLNISLDKQQKKLCSPSNWMYDRKTQRICDEKVYRVKQHIESFPAYESHYTRNKSARQYLSSSLSVAIMYRLYCEECAAASFEPVKKWMSQHIFNTQFNFTFHHPSTDTCKKWHFQKWNQYSES